MFSKISKAISNIGRGVTKLIGGSFGQSLGTSLEKLNNIRIVTDNDVRIHTPELLAAASEMAFAIRNIQVTADVDEKTKVLFREILASTNEILDCVTGLGENVRAGMTDFGLNHFKATAEIVLSQLNSYFVSLLILTVSICVVYRQEEWARSIIAVLSLTLTLHFLQILAKEYLSSSQLAPASSSTSSSDVPLSSKVSTQDLSIVPAVSPTTSLDRSARTHHAPGGLQSRHLIDLLHSNSITSPEPYDGTWAAHKISFHSDHCYHPKNTYENTYVAVDLEAVYWCDKFELRSRGEHNQYVTFFEIHFKKHENDEYTILKPHNNNAFQQFTGLQNDRQHKIYQNFVPFVARYVKIVPRAYCNVPCIKFEISGVPVTAVCE